MKSRRNDLGFTMMEMLVAVSILVVLLALGFVAVMNHQRSMKQLELDKTAQEIYVAAQNHLLMAESEGTLQGKTEKGTELGDEGHYFYFVDGAAESELDPSNSVSRDSVLYAMLPEYSIDETVRRGGSYVIEYDLATASIVNVFFSQKSDMLSHHTFSQSDYEGLFDACVGSSDDAAKNEAAKQARAHYGSPSSIIGWYGGDELGKANVKSFTAPIIEVDNAEKLTVKISNWSEMYSANKGVEGAGLKLYVKGDVSNKTWLVDSGTLSELNVRVGSKAYVLDDVTNKANHFAAQTTGLGLIPGEDITVYAEVYSNKVISKIVRSARKHTNSLYDSTFKNGESATKMTARISNFRHLENLDPVISNLDNDKLGKNAIEGAQQTANLTWTDFKNKTNSEKTQIHPLSGTASAEGTYLPVSNDRLVGYDGGSLYVDGVKVDVAGSAGMFGTLSGCAIKDLELRNFTVSSSDDAAGALVGTLSGASSVTGVIAKETGGATSRVTGVSAGGLVGSLAGTGVVDASAASLLVSASGTNDVVAGGLVGRAANGTTIRNSYAGGHTKEGLYDPDDFNVTATASRGNATAGGLVGATEGATTIENCYATTSVSSANSAGGLVGTASGTVGNCYTTGLVKGTAGNTGAFLGSAGTVTSTGNTYYSIVNPGVPAVGNLESPTGVAAFDENTTTYKAYLEGHAEPAATPYDSTLTTLYNNKYPFKSVKELNPQAPSPTLNITTTHVGDWPAMETLVVNARTSS